MAATPQAPVPMQTATVTQPIVAIQSHQTVIPEQEVRCGATPTTPGQSRVNPGTTQTYGGPTTTNMAQATMQQSVSPGTTVTVTQVATGGPQGQSAVSINVTTPAGGGSAAVAFVFPSYQWGPGLQYGLGFLSTLNVQFAVRCDLKPPGVYVAVTMVPLVIQGGKYYIATPVQGQSFISGVNPGWQTISANLSQSQFGLWQFNPTTPIGFIPQSGDNTQQPNWSNSGGPITIGFAALYNYTGAVQEQCSYAGFQASLQTQNPPVLKPSGPLVAGGTLAPPQPCAVSPLTLKLRDEMRKLLKKRRADDWPYPWVYPVPGSKLRRASNTIAAPANGVITAVASFQVPEGYYFWLTHLLQIYNGSNFTPGSGTIKWTIDINADPVTPSVQGMILHGFVNEVVPLGDLTVGPWQLVEPELLNPNDFIRSKIITTSPIPTGAPNFFTSMFLGWTFPGITELM